MTTRAFLALLILVTLIAGYIFSLLIGSIIAPWFPTVRPENISLAVGALTSLVAFFVVDRMVAQPLRRISAIVGMSDVQGGQRQSVSQAAGPLREFQEFARVFDDFSGRVEATHARDVEISRVKSDFISTAAHQFRTPLTGIRWALEALEKEPLTEAQQALVKSAVDKSHDLVEIVSTLLDITSIESGRHAYDFKDQDIQPLISEVVNDFTPAAAQAQVNLLYQPIPGQIPVRIDRERIRWVLNNLVENAIRYTPAGGSVHLRIEQLPQRVLVKVTDTGIGIPQSERNNIFERFYRAGNAITKQNQGNGLGLYIARTIVQDHKGELSFDANTEGPGTTFTMALPGLIPAAQNRR